MMDNRVGPLDSSENRKLLVLSLDRTLCNFGENENYSQNPNIPRPYLLEFLKNMYKIFDLAIWSPEPLEEIIQKLKTLGLLPNENFKIKFVYDKRDSIPIKIDGSGRVFVKLLSKIWKSYEEYNYTNTIIIDNVCDNFYMNPDSGLCIIPYKQCNHNIDKELVHVEKYLIYLSENCSDFSTADHSKYRDF